MSELAKITEAHRRRRAVVYVRQSSPGQVQRNVESAALQYALADRAVELGWPAASVSVVDDDLGRSGASTDGRLGFTELVAEVGLGHVGLILARETSRLARCSADWHRLLDLCALTGTLIADADGIYDLQDFNDRLLLGLKGQISEAELHLIRSRLVAGLRNKAKRGELRLPLPVGLDRDDDDRVVLSADEQVRHAIERVFCLWGRLGSARQVLMELIGEGQKLPSRTVGQRRIRWARANYGAVHEILTNPAYAGAFVFGRQRLVKRVDEYGQVRVGRVTVPIEEWSVCLPDHHPGYVSWDQYLATRKRLASNVTRPGQGSGAAREGTALLQGLVRCGRCGRTMRVAYSGTRGKVRRYACLLGRDLHATGKACQTVGGARLDKTVAIAFLEAAAPAGIAATAGAIRELEDQHEQRLAGQRLALERAQYEADRAERKYDACEPENRLVARTLERALEQALANLERERGKLAQLERARPTPVTDQEREALVQLTGELPRLWAASTTTDRDRKELLRTLISEVIVTARHDERRADVEVHWEGGARTELSFALNVHAKLEPDRLQEDTLELIRRLAEHHSDRQIAGFLSRQGARTGAGLPFTESRVRGVRRRAGIPAAPPPDPTSQVLSIQRAADQLGVSDQTIRRWINTGLLPAQQTTPGAPWRIRLTDEIRARFVPEIPDGYVPLDEAARRLACSRQTVLNKVQRGELEAIQVTNGQRKGLRIKAPAPPLDQLINQ
jgi:excisionase family DNA binding protein